MVKASDKVAADRGRVAVERGPLVYCAEWADNGFDIMSALMNRHPQFKTSENPEKLYGLVELKTDVQTLGYDENGRLTTTDTELTLIPYYAWAHRGTGKMRVWLPQELNATTPVQPATLASQSKIEASYKESALTAINDGLVPADEHDRSMGFYNWTPKKNSTEWIMYEFPEATKVSSTTVYWYDDAPWGGCRVPKSWCVYYKESKGQWIPVNATGTYGTEKGKGNTVEFDPIQTQALKLEVVLPDDYSSGVFEWEIE